MSVNDVSVRNIIDINVEEPNPAMLSLIGKQWKKMSNADKILIRSQRARRGIKCKVCNTMGYYRITCINECVSPPNYDSGEDTPPTSPRKNQHKNLGLGVLWNVPNENEEQEEVTPEKKYKMSDRDMNAYDLSKTELEKLAKSDANIPGFAFFLKAEEGYKQNIGDGTLHQVMRKLMRALENKIKSNTNKLENIFDETLLHPPNHKEKEYFYPEELKKYKEYEDYFFKHEQKNDKKRTYQFQGNARSSDALDPLFRGKINAESTSELYVTNPEAGQSQHSKVGWKSTLARYDQLAISDPAMIVKMKEVKELFKSQGEWTRLQKKSMEQTNDKFEHITNLLTIEMKSEHEREAKILSNVGKQRRMEKINVWQERHAAVDRIMATLKAYNMIGGLDEIDFLIFCLNKWVNKAKDNIDQGEVVVTLDDGKKKKKKKTPKNKNTVVSVHGMNPYEAEIMLIERKLKLTRPNFGKYKRDDNVSPTKLSTSANDGKFVSPSNSPSGSRAVSPMTVDASNMKEHRLVIPGLSDEHSIISMSGSQSISDSIETALLEKNELDLMKKERLKKEREKDKSSGLLVVHKEKQQSLDKKAMNKAKSYYKNAGLEDHIRMGNSDDVAYHAPTLIPVPGAFKGDGKDISISHTADQINTKIQNNMILGNLGYTPQNMLPLYVRNTLIEKNGTTSGGDQPQEVMALDRRYSHYMGRPLNRFEPGKGLNSVVETNHLGQKIKKIPELSLVEKAAIARRKRRAREGAMTGSLVRIVFGKPAQNLKDLYFQED